MFWCFGKNPKTHHCKIVLLDETEFIQEFQETSKGQQLLDIVFKHLNLMETAYFGLRYIDSNGQRHWLDPNKNITKQLKGLETFNFYFGVKFYASDPCKLLEEITRYQFFLQVKNDIYQGRLPLTFDLAAELLAYAIQSELGDYDPRRHQPGYVAEFRFSPNQTAELEAKAAEIHKSLSGRVPAMAELNFLDRVKWLDMYGVDLHPVLGEDNIEYFLGLTPSGVLVLRNKSKVGNYFWPRITKVFFKRKYFMLRVRDKNNDENTYGFELPNKQACKHLWKCCVEHRAFFKLTQVREVPGQPSKIFGLENKFVYSGRPEKNFQMAGMQARLRTPPTFIRVPSRRYQKRLGQPDGADAGTQAKEELNGDIRRAESRTSIANMQQPILIPSLQRSTSVPSVVPFASPYRVAPWEDSRLCSRGLYSSGANPSPRSVRSAGALPSARRGYPPVHHRSGSVDSTASYDYRKRKHHRRQSDNESEISKSSRNSKSSRSSRHRKHGSQSAEGSDSESQHRHRRHSRRKHHGSSYELVDSEGQWREVQRQNQESAHTRMQAAVVRDLSKRKSGYMNSGLETESETNYSHRRRHRRHRSRSRSPESKNAIPSDVKKYIEYNLIDPNTLTEEERRDIKYTKVQADSRYFKIRYSPPNNRPDMQDSQQSSRKLLNGHATPSSKLPSSDESNNPSPFIKQNGFLPYNHQREEDKRTKESLPPQIPKVSSSGVAYNGCNINGSNTQNFHEDNTRIQNQNSDLLTDWNHSNRTLTTFERKTPVKEDNSVNCETRRPSGENMRYPSEERISGNVRLVNGHYYPPPAKPNSLNQQQYPKQTFSSSRSWAQCPPRANGEVPKSIEVQHHSQSHEMSTEL